MKWIDIILHENIITSKLYINKNSILIADDAAAAATNDDDATAVATNNDDDDLDSDQKALF